MATTYSMTFCTRDVGEGGKPRVASPDVGTKIADYVYGALDNNVRDALSLGGVLIGSYLLYVMGVLSSYKAMDVYISGDRFTLLKNKLLSNGCTYISIASSDRNHCSQWYTHQFSTVDGKTIVLWTHDSCDCGYKSMECMFRDTATCSANYLSSNRLYIMDPVNTLNLHGEGRIAYIDDDNVSFAYKYCKHGYSVVPSSFADKRSRKESLSIRLGRRYSDMYSNI